eukprot:12679769-Alexandrium_andersonii.AAC.1
MHSGEWLSIRASARSCTYTPSDAPALIQHGARAWCMHLLMPHDCAMRARARSELPCLGSHAASRGTYIRAPAHCVNVQSECQHTAAVPAEAPTSECPH